VINAYIVDLTADCGTVNADDDEEIRLNIISGTIQAGRPTDTHEMMTDSIEHH